jgi:hypothetical protein
MPGWRQVLWRPIAASCAQHPAQQRPSESTYGAASARISSHNDRHWLQIRATWPSLPAGGCCQPTGDQALHLPDLLAAEGALGPRVRRFHQQRRVRTLLDRRVRRPACAEHACIADEQARSSDQARDLVPRPPADGPRTCRACHCRPRRCHHRRGLVASSRIWWCWPPAGGRPAPNIAAMVASPPRGFPVLVHRGSTPEYSGTAATQPAAPLVASDRTGRACNGAPRPPLTAIIGQSVSKWGRAGRRCPVLAAGERGAVGSQAQRARCRQGLWGQAAIVGAQRERPGCSCW